MRTALVALVLAACGGGEPAAATPKPPAPDNRVCPDGTSVSGATPCPESRGPEPVASTPPPAPPPTSEPTGLPPPKPTTIPLRTGDAKLDALLDQGDAAFEQGDLAKASSAYEAAKRLAPKRAAPIVGVARVRVAKASPSLDFAAAEKNLEVTLALKDFKLAAGYEPSFGPAEIELGRCYLLLGDATNAEAALRKGVSLSPDEPEAHSALGVALLAMGRKADAATELAKARDLDPGSAARRGNLGTVLFVLGRVGEAIKEYEVEARLAPDDARAHSDLGTALLAQGDAARAMPELRRAIKLDPKRATFHSNMGYALQLSGKPSDAIAEYREAIKLDPKLASAWINLGTVLARDPKTRGEARQALKTAEKLDPSDPRVKANLEELDALEKSSRP